eukprot:2261981-Pleurochrysis_carterae.AAC.1
MFTSESEALPSPAWDVFAQSQHPCSIFTAQKSRTSGRLMRPARTPFYVLSIAGMISSSTAKSLTPLFRPALMVPTSDTLAVVGRRPACSYHGALLKDLPDVPEQMLISFDDC